jgi:hypothetical protein
VAAANGRVVAAVAVARGGEQPWWGTAAQRMEPVASTNIFLDHLLAVPNWQTALRWQAAQQVQASAFTGGSTTTRRWTSR